MIQYANGISYAACVMVVCVLFTNCCTCAGKTFNIAFLAPGPSSNYPINSDTSVDGLHLALRSISKNPNILRGHKIAVKFFDTKCNAQSAVTTAMMTKRTFNPDAIVGPPCQEGLKMVAQLGTYWNLPILNWYHTGNEFRSSKTYPTLVRMLPPLHLLSKSMVHVLTKNNWLHASVLFIGQEPWSLLEDPVREDAASAGVQIHGVYKVTRDIPVTALKRMYIRIRPLAHAIVMICPFEDVRHFLLTAASVGLTNGTHTFIHLDPQIYTDSELTTKVLSNGGWKRGDSMDGQARKAYESVLHVMFDPTTERAGHQGLYPRSKYTDYSRMAVFESRFSLPEWSLPPGAMPDVYSAYLCDAVVVWSVLVDMLDKLKKDYRDGKLMAAYMRRMTASGASGHIELNENLDRLGEVFVLEMQPDGKFQPKQLLKFNKTDGYSVTNMTSSFSLKSKVTRKITKANHKVGRRPPQKDKRYPTTVTTTTRHTTTLPTTTPTTSRTTTPTTTTVVNNEPDIIARLRAIEAAMKISQRQVVEQNYNPTTTKAPTTHKVDVVKPKYKATVDPQLANFDVRLRKKRKLFAKAQSILDKIHETADPNVAAFLRLALERLNAEEDLMALTPQGTHRNSKKVNAQAYKKQAAKIPTSTLPLPLPEPTPPHTYRIPSVVPDATMQPPTTQPSTVTTTASTAVPTTLFYYEEPITETIPASNWQWGYMENMTPMEQPLNGKNNRRKPIRRLRQKWLNKVSLTTPSPTIPTPPWSNVEPVKPDNIMISSIVDQVANSLMGKVTGEIHSLKQSIKSMQSKIAQNKPNDNPRQNALISSNNESKSLAPNIKKGIDRSLVNKVSSNVLTKLSGVSWLGKTQEVPQAEQQFKQSQSSTTTIEPKSTNTHIYTTRPTQKPTTETPTTRKPSKPKILGSWMSGLPPAVSMQLFAEKTVKKDSSNPPKANLNISPKSKESSSGTSRRISTRNNPYNVPKH